MPRPALLLALATACGPSADKPSETTLPPTTTAPSPTTSHPTDPTDVDGDGHGDDDCDDADPAAFPGADDAVGDGVDQDCDGLDGVDADGDGQASVDSGGADCDDADPDSFPGAVDVPYDGVDQDCADGDLVDVDRDGFVGEEAGGDDCDDGDGAAFPGAVDTVGDGVDQGCDGIDGRDGDGDGFADLASGGDDCDDRDPAINPVAAEIWYDDRDEDCDGGCDWDQDGDGFLPAGSPIVDGDPCDLDPGVGVAWGPTDCDDTDAAAQSILFSTSPTDGATGVDTTRGVSATFEVMDPSATLALEDAAGNVVPGTTAWTASTLTFTPDAELALATLHQATLTWGCGTEVWTFTTTDGIAQSISHFWTVGAPDTLTVDVVNPVATRYDFGMAETAAGVVGWYGEDCAGALAYGTCHPMTAPTLVLDSVYPFLAQVVPGKTTLFDSTFDTAITYYLEARDGVQQGTCWTWGQDVSYFPMCIPL